MHLFQLDVWLQTLGRTSLQAGILVLLVLAVQTLLRRHLAPRWRCALWLLVVARLLLPVSFDSWFSVFNALPKFEAHPEPTLAPPLIEPPSKQEMPSTPPTAWAPRDAAASERLAPASAHHATEPPPRFTTVPSASLPPLHRPADASALRALAPIRWQVVLFAAWMIGASILGLHVAVSSWRLSQRLSQLTPLTAEPTLHLLADCRQRLAVRGRLHMVESPDVPTPVLHGFVAPKLVLPKSFSDRFTPTEQRFIFLHELAHVRRRDIAVNWLMALLQVVHWFNPLVWLGFARWRADRELACDALALEAAGADQNREYGRTILRLLENLTPRVAAPGLVGILEDQQQLKARLRMIAGYRPARHRGFWSAMLLASLAIVCLTDAQSTKQNPSPRATVAASPSRSQLDSQEREIRRGTDPELKRTGTNFESREIMLTVIDAETGKPLPNAEITAPPMGDAKKLQPRRLTDDTGRYRVRLALPHAEIRRYVSDFSLAARHPDYASRSVAWTSSGGDVYQSLPGEITLKLSRGVPMGGIVQDEKSHPLPRVRVLLFGSGFRGYNMGGNERLTHEISVVLQNDLGLPAATTDDTGRWTFAHFPQDLDQVEVTFVRPDGAREVYATANANATSSAHGRPVISLAELKEMKAVVRLREGVTVRGMVVDEQGSPIAGAEVREGYGHGSIVVVSEFPTDLAGRFERPHRAPRQWIYTATAPGRATVSTVAQVEPGMPEVRIVLPVTQPLKLWVTDEAGQPLPEVEFTIDTLRTEAQILDWSGTTDATGLVVWTNPPTAAVTLYAIAHTTGAHRKVKVGPGETEKHVKLSPTAMEKIVVRVKVVDAETRKPVRAETVSARSQGGFSALRPLEGLSTDTFTAEIRRADFRVGMFPSYELKVEAEGYASLTTERIDFDLGDQDLELGLTRIEGSSVVRVLKPDGDPAMGARLWVRATSDYWNKLFINAPGHYYGDRLANEQSGGDGRLKLPGAPDDAPAVITHPEGFLEMPMARLRTMRDVRLQSYGAVEGRLLIAGQPKGHVNVSLTKTDLSPTSGFQLIYSVNSDADGRFAFTQVPPGEFRLYRYTMPKSRGNRGGRITETWQMPVTVRPNETNTLKYAFSGRAVIGQARPDKAEGAVDWQNDVHVLSLKLPNPQPEIQPNREDFATFAAFTKAHNASLQARAQLKEAPDALTCQLTFEEDGSFRAEDVPPGTYELRIRVTKPEESDNRSPMMREGKELGLLIRDVIVSEGKEPLDLGTLTVPVKDDGDAVAKQTPPLRLLAQTFEGRPLTLEPFKGRNVLLTFWASWSQRSLEQLAELNKFRTELPSDASLAFVSVSLDEDAASARKITESHGHTWTQGWLDAKGRLQASAAFNVHTLPTVILLDSEGRVVARDLEGERLPVTVRRQLARK